MDLASGAGRTGVTLFSYSDRPVPSVLSMAKIVRKILVSFVS
jgi:gentisate 1,2-dioxygenase